MKEILTVEMNLDDYLEPKIYFQADPNDENDYRALDNDTKDDFVKSTKSSPELASALINLQYDLKETLNAIKQDMADLYKEIKALKESK